MLDERFARLRTHHNIARYRGLLRTNLTDLERQFVERRLSEEQSKFELLSAGTFPAGPIGTVWETHYRPPVPAPQLRPSGNRDGFGGSSFACRGRCRRAVVRPWRGSCAPAANSAPGERGPVGQGPDRRPQHLRFSQSLDRASGRKRTAPQLHHGVLTATFRSALICSAITRTKQLS